MRTPKFDKNLTKEFLTKEYIKNKKNSNQIAKIIECSGRTVCHYLNKFKIKTRDLKRENNPNYIDGRTFKKYYCKELNCNNEICSITYLKGSGKCIVCSNTGKYNSAYIDGRTLLSKRIRRLTEYNIWRTEIFKRDNFICQECYKTNCYLEAHHKKEFHIIFVEFLKEYDQFSHIEDKETLIRLAMKYKDFWNIDNGKTLCEDCHNLTKTGRQKTCLKILE